MNSNYTLTREISLVWEAKTTTEVTKISNSADSYKYLKPLFANSMQIYEEVYAIFLDRNCQIVGFLKVSQGGITSSVVDVRLIFATALKCLATSVILAHNHPSGNLQPSNDDRTITKIVSEAGRLLNISLLDHLIITENHFYSFADNGEF